LKYLFMIRPDHDPERVPNYVWTVFDWIGLSRDQVQIVTKPVRVDTLKVLPQPEWLMSPPARPGYLELLESRAVRHGLEPVRSDFLYVTRVGAIAAGLGAHAGEGYLVQALTRAGVPVMEPSKVPLREQLARYAGAGTIIFAEGSAVHGRQLLGRIDQRVVILNRRAQNAFAQNALTCRTRETTYGEVVGTSLEMRHTDERLLSARALALYDVQELFRCFDALGIDLRRQWDARDYVVARDRDIAFWLSRLYLMPGEHKVAESLDLVRRALDGAGIVMPSQSEALEAAASVGADLLWKGG
jgi:Glycosyltransferase 61